MASSLISARVATWAALMVAAFLVGNSPAYAETDAVIARNHPAVAERVTSSGRLEALRPLSMSVTLALRNRDQLQQLLADQQDLSSPEFHHFLTPEEFAVRFGPDDFEAVREWLSSEGFKVIATNTAARVIQFTGTVAQAERTFAVGIQSFGGASFGNTTDPHIPSRFAGVIGHLHGLDNMTASMPGLTASRVKQVVVRDSAAGGVPQASTSSTVPGFHVPGVGPTFFGPSDFYTFYDETPLLRSGLKGSSCIGIIGVSKFLPNAIAFFNTKFKVGSGSQIATVFMVPRT